MLLDAALLGAGLYNVRMSIKTDVDMDSVESKTCSQCGLVKPLSEYHRSGDYGTVQPCKDCRAEWYKTHNLQQVARNHNAKAKRVGCAGTLTAADLADILQEQGAACLVCQATEHLHFDHVISFYCKGSNTRDNIQILCASHNSSKGRMCIDYRP
jgi:5-methylcytosine-specific restriction endonuclease McrA